MKVNVDIDQEKIEKIRDLNKIFVLKEKLLTWH